MSDKLTAEFNRFIEVVKEVMGQLQQGQTLKALNTLTDADGMGTVSYQWYADAAPVSTGNTLTLQQGHVGKAISVKASYTDAFGKVEGVWSPSTEAVANLNDAPVGAPTIIGNLWAGQTLTAQTNGISDADSVGALSGFQYQWFADGEAIDSALASTLILTSELVGKAISVEASYVDGGDTEETLLSAATGQIAASETPGVVTVTGNARQGQLLQASVSDDDGVPGVAGVVGVVAWKWFADGVAVTGQTASTLQLTQAQVNKTITASASYTDGHGNVYGAVGVTGALASVLSNASARVANVNDAPTGAVTITGTAKQFMTLTAVTSTLADLDGMGSLSYQWKANGVNIAGATGSTFTPNLQSQVGQKISVAVSYTDGFGTKESKTSASTALVLNGNDAPSGSIIVSGTPSAAGSTLTASNSFVDPDGAVGAVTYSWSMSDPVTGASTSLGSGATLSFGASQVNKNITVTATYSDGTYANTVLSGALRLGSALADTLSGAGLDDLLYGDAGNDVLTGAAGNDTLFGGAGNDALTGGVGNDTFTVDVGSDTVVDLGNGADVLVVAAGATANVTMAAAWNATASTVNNGVANISTNGYAVNLALASGSAGFNVTNTGSSGTILTGSSLANTLTSGAGNDSLVGGAGNDTYIVNSSADVVTEQVNGGTDTVQLNAVVTSAYLLAGNVENLRLMDLAAASSAAGNGLDNVIFANGASGVSSFDGGAGKDTLSYYYAAIAGVTSLNAPTTAGVTLNLVGAINPTGYVTASGAFGADQVKGIENLVGSAYADTLTGTSLENSLAGGAGNDSLSGGAGADTLSGELGKDTLTGGSGADKFLFNVLETTANRDTISDFLGSEGDKIQFSKSVFTGFANVGTGTITAAMLAVDGAAQTTSTRLIYNTTSGVLSYDADGSGSAQAAVEVALIGVTTHATLNTTHFEIVA